MITLPLMFFVPGLPKGQPRVRACRRGPHAGVYDPGTADSWKAAIATAALAALGEGITDAPIDWPVCVDCIWTFPRPKSHFLRGGLRKDTPVYHATKPDRDNLDKAVLDALVHWRILRDDCLVVGGVLAKVYASGETGYNYAGAVITIRHPGGEP